jgi:MraZ protein
VVKFSIYLVFKYITQSQAVVNSFIGTYECKVDAKGRLMLPAALKKQMDGVLQDGFVIKRAVFQECLELYPMTEWDALMQKINKLNRFKKKNNDFIRRFTAGVKMVEVDANGRLLIPKDLVVFASISKDIVMSSAVNIIEIWDKTKYEKAIDDATVDFADLAEEVMGQDDDDGLS